MKIENLEVGKIYECKLSKVKVLVIEQEKEIQDGVKDDKPVTKIIKVKIGKWYNRKDDDTLTYYYQELFDGQLTKLT